MCKAPLYSISNTSWKKDWRPSKDVDNKLIPHDIQTINTHEMLTSLRKRQCWVSNNPKYLRVGNLPPGTRPNQLLRFLNQAMIQADYCYFDETPIRNCLVYDNVAIVGFATSTWAHKALNLNGSLFYMGKRLDIGRPRNYIGEMNKRTKPKSGRKFENTRDMETSWNTLVHTELRHMQDTLRQIQEQKGDSEPDPELVSLSNRIHRIILKVKD